MREQAKRTADRSKFGRRGLGHGNAKPKPPAEPTLFLPGSEEKIMLFWQRIANGEELSTRTMPRFGRHVQAIPDVDRRFA